MGKVHINKGRVAIALVALVITMSVVDGVRREFFRSNTINAVEEDGVFLTQSQKVEKDDSTVPFTLDENGQPTTAFDGVMNIGQSEESIPAAKLSQGLLVLADEAHPVAAGSTSNMLDLYGCKNEYYTLIEEGVMLNSDAAEALNSLMAGYNAATGLDDFVVYGTTETYTGMGSFCPRYFQESVTGNTVDLALNGLGSVIEFDGYDAEGWVVQNCAKYGFIVRYPQGKQDKTGESFCPWHLRYVGKLHAAIMEKNQLCLEEYLEYIKSYTMEDPFEFTYDGVGYVIYYIPKSGDVTTARVPLGGSYDISGNNTDGFIVTYRK